ncbi:bifunctional UDP-N-acetylglucosamine diphosphorylase/glucosamine-1-phosphate N-acetyltransferase GlmU [Dialister succinatiphilus]|uniref:bifunctional UDP-N-acetylglucosamine diphosphorylase/glucosamine-1-phosphate N-acetyltransferase GlmU n=1 Tax=Dialister succinatiphilus TaxID=487173 RepID=UPI003F812986
MADLTALILAAGQGTRMKSALPKVLHRVCGVPMVEQVIRVVRQAGFAKCVVITGFKEELVRKDLSGQHVDFVHQAEQLGTGHAVMQGAPLLTDREGYVLVICGDTPLLRSETIAFLAETCRKENASAAVLTAILTDPFGYGRVLRDEKGQMTSIVEQKDGTPEQLAVHEINTGTYVFKAGPLLDALKKIDNKNAQGEYYLTDVFEIMIREGQKVIPVAAEDADETMGVNSRVQLAAADRVLRLRKAEELMSRGVSIINPENTYVEQDVEVGQDTILYPGTILQGKTVIGKDCIIGPDTQLTDVTVGEGTHLNRVYAHECTIGNFDEIGPFVHLRPNTVLHDHIKIGNFVEVKNSTVDDGTKLPHLIYCGDSDLGRNVNFGCGTVTVNFDGKTKHRCRVDDHAFIGCNTNLVAPVHIGERAFTAAGSTITKDVPAKALSVARARQTNIEDWVKEDTYKD